jgi:hypothetical protein
MSELRFSEIERVKYFVPGFDFFECDGVEFHSIIESHDY